MHANYSRPTCFKLFLFMWHLRNINRDLDLWNDFLNFRIPEAFAWRKGKTSMSGDDWGGVWHAVGKSEAWLRPETSTSQQNTHSKVCIIIAFMSEDVFHAYSSPNSAYKLMGKDWDFKTFVSLSFMAEPDFLLINGFSHFMISHELTRMAWNWLSLWSGKDNWLS